MVIPFSNFGGCSLVIVKKRDKSLVTVYRFFSVYGAISVRKDTVPVVKLKKTLPDGVTLSSFPYQSDAIIIPIPE